MILVTGATGLIGSHILYALLQTEDCVKAIRRDEKSTQKTLHTFSYYTNKAQEFFDKITWCDADITYIPSLIEAFDGVDEVFHCAGYIDFDSSQFDALMEINMNGTANVVNACLQLSISKLYYISSISALGGAVNGAAITEESEWQIKSSNSAYSASKFKAEMEVFRGQAEGLDVCVVNPGVVIGPGDWKTGSSAIFGAMWKGLQFFPPGKIAVVDVRDVVKVLLELRKQSIYNERFIVVTENIPIKDFLIAVADSIGRPRPQRKLSAFVANIAWRVEKIRSRITGVSPLITKAAIRSSFSSIEYSNKKIKEAIHIEFIPISQSIKETGALFIKDTMKDEKI